jgi:hypothetical protein
MMALDMSSGTRSLVANEIDAPYRARRLSEILVQ